MKVFLFYWAIFFGAHALSAQNGNVRVIRDTVKRLQTLKINKQLPVKAGVTSLSTGRQIQTGLDKIMDNYAGQPNTEATWSNIRSEANNLLYTFFRDGRLKGVDRHEAYYINIGQQSMTATDIDTGRKILIVGYAAVKPAEFDTIRIERSPAAK
ncbi:MAG: hypothetical protein JNN00_08310 [Chitinophagaceae bacterium]|nr:hypothetical protein [Chitinophagaceae bacterium]